MNIKHGKTWDDNAVNNDNNQGGSRTSSPVSRREKYRDSEKTWYCRGMEHRAKPGKGMKLEMYAVECRDKDRIILLTKITVCVIGDRERIVICSHFRSYVHSISSAVLVVSVGCHLLFQSSVPSGFELGTRWAGVVVLGSSGIRESLVTPVAVCTVHLAPSAFVAQ